MKFDQVRKAVAENPTYIAKEVAFHMNVLERINSLLDRKFQGKKKLLAQAMGKSESEISKWFSGYQNFTISTLMKLESAFEEDIVTVCADLEDDNITCVYVMQSAEEKSPLIVSNGGELEFTSVEPK